MLFNERITRRLQAQRAEEAVEDVAEDSADDLSDAESGGGETADSTPETTQTQDRKPAVHPAQRRLDAEKAALKRKIAELETRQSRLKEETLQELSSKITSALSGKGATSAEEDDPEPDRFTEPEAYRAWSRRRDERLIAEAEARATARASFEADRKTAERIMLSRNLDVERDFTERLGLRWNQSVGGYEPIPGFKNGWTPEEWTEFTGMLKWRFRPTGEYGEWTEEDLEDARLVFKRDDILLDAERRGQRRTLDHLNPEGRRTARKGMDDGRASNGMTMDEILRFIERNPQDKVDDLLFKQLTADERNLVHKVVRQIEREWAESE